MSAPNLSLELSPSTFDLRTNELLHHYRTTLYASVADDCPPTVWCVAIPQLGLEHPFILSGLLAISALHLASMVPQRRQELHILAFAQQSLALPSFRSVMRSPKPENIPAIFIFAASIVYYVMASPDQVDRCRLPRRNDEHPHWFQTMRGFTTLLGNHRTQLAGGPLGALVHFKDGKNHAPEYPDDGRLAKLHGMFSSDMSSSTPLSERIVENCKGALEDLRQIAGLSYSATSFNGKTFACMWPGDLSQEFAELVYDRDPRALVIMAHYCVLLKRLDYVWFLESLGTGLLENIRQALAEEWLPWIAWALEQPVLTN
ncbi:uncharacterized protein PAC_08208 [Phialocephala subalpina]|uniref:C6 finger domain protein n=1 Tax=Phialocephala subalpina TaxID=576137 RepID=A0A1L7WZY0_9HELO|nr:uncharacterized protein PAC_08208 [Phialocephala subalpina]